MIQRYLFWKQLNQFGLIMAVYSGHKMISGNKRTRKQMGMKEVEE